MRAIVSQSPHMCACDGVSAFPMSCLPLVSPLSPIVSHCLPSCFRVLDGVSAFPRFCLSCLPTCLSSWFPSELLRFLKVSALVLDGVSAFSRSCLPVCLPVCLPACLSSCFSLWRVVSFCIFSQACTVRVLNAF